MKILVTELQFSRILLEQPESVMDRRLGIQDRNMRALGLNPSSTSDIKKYSEDVYGKPFTGHQVATILQIGTAFIPVVGPFISAGIGFLEAKSYWDEGDKNSAVLTAIFSSLPVIGKIPGVKELGKKGMTALATKITKLGKNFKPTVLENKVLDGILENIDNVKKDFTEYLKTLRKKTVSRSMTPIGYDPLKPLSVPGELLLPKMTPKTWATQNRMDAWYLYNGLKPKYDTFEKIGKNVYKIKKFNIDKNALEKIINYPSNKFPSVKIENELNFGAIHGNGTIEKGIDEMGRKFIEFSDLWDLQPLKKVKFLPSKIKNLEFSDLGGGKPFWTKNRIYYDDLGNFFDSDGTKLIKSTEFVKNADFKNWVTYFKTKNLGNATQQEVLNDWERIASYGMAKSMLTPLALISGFILKTQIDSKKFYLKVVKAAKKKNMTIEEFEKWCHANTKECNPMLK